MRSVELTQILGRPRKFQVEHVRERVVLEERREVPATRAVVVVVEVDALFRLPLVSSFPYRIAKEKGQILHLSVENHRNDGRMRAFADTNPSKTMSVTHAPRSRFDLK